MRSESNNTVKVSKALAISMSFVGLLVGAGFATGQEVVQYFTSFGVGGIWGIVVAGIVMTLAGTVFLQMGSYFHAREHNSVFKEVSHPLISKFLDVSVVVTLFAVGFVMLAGAGSNVNQQFDVPAWIGSLIMVVLVMAAGMLNVDKVSKVIGMLTPSIIIAVAALAIYTALNLPDDVSGAIATSGEMESPIGHWLLSALNYNGLALIMAVSMTLVIGGDNINPREAGAGGILGGVIYLIMLGLAGFALIMNAEAIGDSDIPMLQLVEDISPVLGVIMFVIIYLMIFNTAIGMFYALGKRLSAGREGRYRVIFLGTCLAGFAVSFVGFSTLMEYVYPVLGYLGMVLLVVMVWGWFKALSKIKDESARRAEIRKLLTLKLSDDEDYDSEKDAEIGHKLEESNMDSEELYEDTVEEVSSSVSKRTDKKKSEVKDDAEDADYFTEKA